MDELAMNHDGEDIDKQQRNGNDVNMMDLLTGDENDHHPFSNNDDIHGGSTHADLLHLHYQQEQQDIMFDKQQQILLNDSVDDGNDLRESSAPSTTTIITNNSKSARRASMGYPSHVVEEKDNQQLNINGTVDASNNNTAYQDDILGLSSINQTSYDDGKQSYNDISSLSRSQLSTSSITSKAKMNQTAKAADSVQHNILPSSSRSTMSYKQFTSQRDKSINTTQESIMGYGDDNNNTMNKTSDFTQFGDEDNNDGRGRSRVRNFMSPTASSRSKSREKVQVPSSSSSLPSARRSLSPGPSYKSKPLTEPSAPNLLTSIRQRSAMIASSTTRELEEIRAKKQALLEQKKKDELKVQSLIHNNSSSMNSSIATKKLTVPSSPNLATQKRGDVVDSQPFKSAAEIGSSFLNKDLRQGSSSTTSISTQTSKPSYQSTSTVGSSNPTRKSMSPNPRSIRSTKTTAITAQEPVVSLASSKDQQIQARSPASNSLSFVERTRLAQEQRELRIKKLMEEKEKAELSLSAGFKAKPVPSSTFRGTSPGASARRSLGTSRISSTTRSGDMNSTLSSINTTMSDMNISHSSGKNVLLGTAGAGGEPQVKKITSATLLQRQQQEQQQNKQQENIATDFQFRLV